jgi:hypothetical protein
LGDIVVDMGYFDVVVDIKLVEFGDIRLEFKHNSRVFRIDEEFN